MPNNKAEEFAFTQKEIASIIRLAELSFLFGQINRVTAYPDGVRPESDTDHTFMLCLLACTIASKEKDLDLGLVAQFAIVHDFVEVYAGDTPTYGQSLNNKSKKELREKEALEKLKTEFGQTYPWLTETIEKYESLATKEACFIKTLDKILPKITNLLNEFKILRQKTNTQGFADFAEKQLQELKDSYGAKAPKATALYEAIKEVSIKEFLKIEKSSPS